MLRAPDLPPPALRWRWMTFRPGCCGSQAVQQLRRAILTAVVDHPSGELSGWVAQRCQPFHQTRHHSLFVSGGHNHIKAGKLLRIHRRHGHPLTTTRQLPTHHRTQAIPTKHQSKADGRPERTGWSPANGELHQHIHRRTGTLPISPVGDHQMWRSSSSSFPGGRTLRGLHSC